MYSFLPSLPQFNLALPVLSLPSPAVHGFLWSFFRVLRFSHSLPLLLPDLLPLLQLCLCDEPAGHFVLLQLLLEQLPPAPPLHSHTDCCCLMSPVVWFGREHYNMLDIIMSP